MAQTIVFVLQNTLLASLKRMMHKLMLVYVVDEVVIDQFSKVAERECD